jgi:hypothetical protein
LRGKGSTEPDFVITRETPNQQSKNRVAYNYRTPTREGKFGMQVEEELVWPKPSSKAVVFEVWQVYDRTRL